MSSAAPTSSFETLATFVSQRTGGWMTVERVRDVMTRIVAGPESVRELRRDDRLVAVAVLVDNCATEGNAAELSLFHDGASPAELDELLAWALTRLAQGERTQVDIPQWPGTALPEGWLEARGFHVAYRQHQMERRGPLDAGGEGAGPLPAGWQWRLYDDSQFEAYYEVLAKAFRTVPGAFVQDAEACRTRTRSLDSPPDLLVVDGRVAGFVRVAVTEGGAGEIFTLARHPDFRAHGLGAYLLRRGLERLVAAGALIQHLEVAAANARAVELYERFGFRSVSGYAVHRRPVVITSPP